MVVEGTDARGPAQGPRPLRGHAVPGHPGTVAIAGHRTTYLAPFRKLDKMRRGDRIILEMPYGRFTYRIELRRIVEPGAYA